MEKEYFTIAGTSASEHTEKKSIFISNAKSVESERDALTFIESVREKYNDASHHVYAYYIISDTGVPVIRYSDDKEPSGTAGLPTLNAIQRKSLQNIVMVTTRYFGGIMLGASGLIRAYGKSSSLCIEHSNLVIRCLMDELHVKIDYSLLGKVQNMLHEREAFIKETEYSQNVTIRLLTPTGQTDHLSNELIQITNASAHIHKENTYYATLDTDRNIL